MSPQRLSFPMFFLTDAASGDLYLCEFPPHSGDKILLLFATEEAATKFGQWTEDDLLGNGVASATKLLGYLNSMPQVAVNYVLVDASLNAKNETDYAQRIHAEDFYQLLVEQAAVEARFRQN